MPPILEKETGAEDIPSWRPKAWPQLGVACPEDISVLVTPGTQVSVRPSETFLVSWKLPPKAEIFPPLIP